MKLKLEVKVMVILSESVNTLCWRQVWVILILIVDDSDEMTTYVDHFDAFFFERVVSIQFHCEYRNPSYNFCYHIFWLRCLEYLLRLVTLYLTLRFGIVVLNIRIVGTIQSYLEPKSKGRVWNIGKPILDWRCQRWSILVGLILDWLTVLRFSDNLRCFNILLLSGARLILVLL